MAIDRRWMRRIHRAKASSTQAGGANATAASKDLKYGLWAGIYAPQLAAWAASVGRGRLLVLESGSMLKDLAASLALVARFLDLPPDVTARAAGADKQTRINALEHGKKQRAVSCAARAALDAVFDPANDALYATLAEARAARDAPGLEPPFPRFRPFPCRDAATAPGRPRSSGRAAAAAASPRDGKRPAAGKKAAKKRRRGPA